jgi:hypothetical protein
VIQVIRSSYIMSPEKSEISLCIAFFMASVMNVHKLIG